MTARGAIPLRLVLLVGRRTRTNASSSSSSKGELVLPLAPPPTGGSLSSALGSSRRRIHLRAPQETEDAAAAAAYLESWRVALESAIAHLHGQTESSRPRLPLAPACPAAAAASFVVEAAEENGQGGLTASGLLARVVGLDDLVTGFDLRWLRALLREVIGVDVCVDVCVGGG